MATVLTFKELQLIQNAEVFFLKNSIIQKCYHLFGNITEQFNSSVKPTNNLPPNVFLQSPKISKGENYLGLPWVMLDYFRLFNVENSFAIRCFFWWGNSFSFHIYATGNLQLKMFKQLHTLSNNWYGCINPSPWLHEFTTHNYIPIADAMNAYKIQSHPFIKLGCYIPIQEWQNAETFYVQAFREALNLLD